MTLTIQRMIQGMAMTTACTTITIHTTDLGTTMAMAMMTTTTTQSMTMTTDTIEQTLCTFTEKLSMFGVNYSD